MTVQDKCAITEAWLERTSHEYPEGTAQILLAQGDRFHNPAGHALREGLPVLLDAVLGETELDGAGLVLEDLLRIRAVQGFPAAGAVSFILLLKPILRERFGIDERIEGRIDLLTSMALEAFTRCRERLLALRVNESRRQTFVLERMLEKRTLKT